MEPKETTAAGRENRPRSITSTVVLAAGLYALIQAHAVMAPILLSFLLIILITLAVNPLVSRLRNLTGGRIRATGMVLVGLLVLVALAFWAAVVPLKQSITTLSGKLPAYWERLQKPLIKMEQKASISEEKLQDEVSAEIARESPKTGAGAAPPPAAAPVRAKPSPPEDASTKADNGDGSLRSGIGSMIISIFGQVKGVALNTTEMLLVLITVFFGVTFTLMNPGPIFGAMFSVLPERHHARTLVILQRIARFVPRWALSVVFSMLTIGSLFFLLMWPVFGFADAILLGLIACLFSVIPFLGPLLTLIPALLLAIGEGGMTPTWVVLAYLAVQALEGNVILPIIMSRGMKLHPVAVIFSMLLSVAAFGVLGVLIAAPLVAIVGIVHEEVFRKQFLPSVSDAELKRLARAALLRL